MNGLGWGGWLKCGMPGMRQVSRWWHIKAHTWCPPAGLLAPQWSDLNPWYVCQDVAMHNWATKYIALLHFFL